MENCHYVTKYDMYPPPKKWFALRDLSRRNAKVMAHDILRNEGLEVFTPMKDMIMTVKGKRQRRHVPVIQDLLFVHESKEILDTHVMRHPNIQYRYCIGKPVSEPLTVRERDMEIFIRATSCGDNSKYYMPDELTPSMLGRSIRIVGGVLDGFEGRLLSVRGMRARRILVEIPGFIVSAVEVDPDYIQFV